MPVAEEPCRLHLGFIYYVDVHLYTCICELIRICIRRLTHQSQIRIHRPIVSERISAAQLEHGLSCCSDLIRLLGRLPTTVRQRSREHSCLSWQTSSHERKVKLDVVLGLEGI